MALNKNPQLSDDKLETLSNVKFNPLCDYAAQIAPKSYFVGKTLGETSLKDDFRIENKFGFSEDTPFSFRNENGNFEYSKLINISVDYDRNKILSLSPNAQTLFLWLLYNLEFKKEIYTIELEKAIKTGLRVISLSTFNRAIKELVKARIILKVGTKGQSDSQDFFINPQIMWRGDSKNYYTEVTEQNPDFLKRSEEKIPPIVTRNVKRNS